MQMQYDCLALVVSALSQEREVEEVPELSATTVWFGHQGKIMTSLTFAIKPGPNNFGFLPFLVALHKAKQDSWAIRSSPARGLIQ